MKHHSTIRTLALALVFAGGISGTAATAQEAESLYDYAPTDAQEIQEIAATQDLVFKGGADPRDQQARRDRVERILASIRAKGSN